MAGDPGYAALVDDDSTVHNPTFNWSHGAKSLLNHD